MSVPGDEPNHDSEIEVAVETNNDSAAEPSSIPAQSDSVSQSNDLAPVGQGQDESTESQPRKKLKLSEADKKRSVRMFGALMGTLSKFQDETSKMKQTDAAKRRAEVESRLQAKLKVESEALHQLRELELEEKNLRQNTLRKTEELGYLSATTSNRFANKLAFSNYLRTYSPNLKDADRTEPPLNAEARLRNQDHQIYWLPRKLTPDQKDLIESQRRAAREEVEEAQRLWDEEKLQKQEELEQLQATQDARIAEIEAEKARSRATNPSNSTSDDVQMADEPSPVDTKAEESARKEPLQTQNEVQDAPNDHGRDEDAVEY